MAARNVLEILDKYCDFCNIISSENWTDSIICKLPSTFSYRYFEGASKGVIIPSGASYVIKIPFQGYEESYYIKDENGYDSEISTFYNFEGARFGEHDNYCLDETILWRKAKEAGIEDAFCKTKLLGFVQEYPIYVQERAETYKERKRKSGLSNYSTEETDRTSSYCEEKKYRVFDPIWQTDALKYYGEDKFNKIMNFLKENFIDDDLHSSNIGYIGDKPVFIDYSGFYC